MRERGSLTGKVVQCFLGHHWWLQLHFHHLELACQGQVTQVTQTFAQVLQRSTMMEPFTLPPWPSPHSVRLDSSRVQAGAFTSAIWTRLNKKFCRQHHSKHLTCLLYTQTTTLCSDWQMTSSEMRGWTSPTLELSQAWHASLMGQPSVNAVSHTTQAEPKNDATVNGPHTNYIQLIR